MERFHEHKWKAYKNIGYVHVAAHGVENFGIGLIGGVISWQDVGEKLKILAPRLMKDQQRVLVISCCFSSFDYYNLRTTLRSHFTGCYYLQSDCIGFADTATVWAMFYKKKTIGRPHAAVRKRINDFFGKDLLAFGVI